MALRGKKPELIQKRLKALFYGQAGVGKTTCAIQFPRPYLIDTERGAENEQYVKLLNQSGGAYFFTTDPDDLITEVRALLEEQHPYKTLIIDPLTVIYNDLLDRSADEVGTDFGRHKGPADRKIKHLLTLLTRLDMNVIITSHAKAKWVRAKDAKGKDTVIEEGLTFDCYGKLDYLFDLVFEIQKRGKQRIGIVKKTRIEGFPEGEQFPFSYDDIANKYGREVLERDSVAQKLATLEQISDVKHFVELLKVPKETQDKWLDKANSLSWEEMPFDAMQKIIDHLNSRLSKNAA
jgi:DNA polymerase III delta prime subunit